MKVLTIILIALSLSSVCFTQPTREWIRSYNGTGASEDWAGPMTLDASGNIYVAGRSMGSGSQADIVTIKYNSAGVQLWQNRFNRTGSVDDEPSCIAVDNSGNVYVGGVSNQPNNDYPNDYVLIKYNSSGVQQWVRFYDGPLNWNDRLNAMVLDASGNIYITGESMGSSNLDYFTMKYNPAGDTLWTRRANFGYYNYEHDMAYSITLDQTGNVYITGKATRYPADNIIATVKYNSSGVEQWAKIYDSPGIPEGKVVKVDANNNVYVAGMSMGTGSGVAWNYLTIKMNSNGDTLWTKQYNGTGNNEDRVYDMTLDISGNIIVTGRSIGNSSNYDYATVKYSPSGSELWVQRYNGAQNHVDEAYSVVADSSLNIYVAGKTNEGSPTQFDMTMIKYSPGGSQLWIEKFDTLNGFGYATTVRTFGSNTIYLFGSQTGFGSSVFYDFVLVKYAQPIVSDTCFVRTTSCSQNNTYGFSEMKTDASGNVYAVGTCITQNPTNAYIYTVKYNSSGVLQWAQILDTGYIDLGSSIDIDANSNVYVGGTSVAEGSYSFYFVTIKYSPSGQRLWTRINPLHIGQTRRIRVDASGNVVVTGLTTTWGDIRTIKFDSNGNELWIQDWNGPSDDTDEPLDMVIDNSNNIIISGNTKDVGPLIIMNYVTLKYNSSGVLQWSQTYNRYSENSIGVAIDRTDNVYVTGTSNLSIGNSDIATIKYNPSGVQQWVQLYDGPGNSGDGVGGIAVDTLGNVYIAGASTDGAITIKYNTSGVQQWLQAYKYNDSSSVNMSITLDRQGNVYTFGLEGNSTPHLITSKYNPSGSLVWQKVVSAGSSQNYLYYRKNIGTDYYGNVYVACGNYVSQSIDNLLIYKYCQDIPVGITQTNTEMPQGFCLYQNYPNPFNPSTKIKFSIPTNGKGQTADIRLVVYNLLGQEVVTLVNQQMKPGTYEVDMDGSNFSSGVYFYKLITDGFSETKKMVLIK